MDPTQAVDALSDPDPLARIEAAQALSSLGAEAPETLEPLARAVADDDEGVRQAACEALEARFLVPDG